MREIEATKPVVRWLVWGLVLLCAARPAYADPVLDTSPSQSDDARPWAAGVPRREQDAALTLYVAGNQEFAESRFAQALARYREAIRHWDHPAIRFNMAVCQINLGQVLEAHADLERSMIYGDAALGPDALRQAITYRRLLDAQLARVTITGNQPGAQITLDGKWLFTGPGRIEQIAMPGEHQIVATKPGFATDSKTVVLVAGQATSHEVRILQGAAPPVLVRRWSTWLPRSMLVAGGVLGAGGAWSYAAAARNIERYDRGIEVRCAQYCSAEVFASFSDLRRAQNRGYREQAAAFSLFAAGGLAVVAGVAGLVMNQPRVVGEPGSPQPVVVPTPGGALLSLRWGL